jgi:hypothetical protein
VDENRKAPFEIEAGFLDLVLKDITFFKIFERGRVVIGMEKNQLC